MNTLQGGSAANGQPVSVAGDGIPALMYGAAWGTSVPVLEDVELDKWLRKDIDALTQRVKALRASRERSLAITKLQEAVMWLGMDLKRIGEANPGLVVDPYPNSKDPSNTVIDKTADGLQM